MEPEGLCADPGSVTLRRHLSFLHLGFHIYKMGLIIVGCCEDSVDYMDSYMYDATMISKNNSLFMYYFLTKFYNIFSFD